jgi:hypothetical protein
MAWELDTSNITTNEFKNDESYSNWTKWRNEVDNSGVEPIQAARNLDLVVKSLSGSEQYEVKLGNYDRVTFTKDSSRQVATVQSLGGHT